MNSNISRLEEKLAEYERSAPIADDVELLYALDTIIEEQNSLPPSEKDTVLIEEAVSAALSLRGTDVRELEKISEDIARANVASVRKNTKRTSPVLHFGRRGIAVAAALVMIAATSIIGFTSGYSWLQELYSRISEADSGELLLTSMSKEYHSLTDMVKEFEIKDVLLPYNLPEGLSFNVVTAQTSYAQPIEGEELVNYSMFDIRTTGDCTWQEIYIESENLGTSAEGESRCIGGREVTYYLDGARHCAFFRTGGYTYTVTATEYTELEALILALT